MALPLEDQISQLDEAREIVLSDPALYPRVVGSILPIVGANAALELQRWGVEFLADTFASPVIPNKVKEQMAISVLSTLKDLLEIPGGHDTAVLKGVVQASASVYPLIFKYMYVLCPWDSSICISPHTKLGGFWQYQGTMLNHSKMAVSTTQLMYLCGTIWL